LTKDLRYFLSELNKKMPDEIVRIKKEVNPKFELSGVIRKFQDEGSYPAVLFEKVHGCKIPVLSNLFASNKRISLALKTSEDKLLNDYMKLEDQRITPKKVKKGPIKDIILSGNKVNLHKLPIITHCEKDAGPYITSGVYVFKDPDIGFYDLGMFRMQIKTKNKVGILFGDYAKAARIIRKNEERNKPTEFALFIGHHPACILASQTKVPYGEDEFKVLSGLLKEPIELIKAETVDLEVPARAEIVIEGLIPPKVREPEAPFGEYTFYYGPRRNSHVGKISAITMRRDAIFHDIFSAHKDHNMCAMVQRESVLYKRIKMAVPSLKSVHLPISGNCRHNAYISITKEFDGQGKIAALAALASDPMMKLAVIVDDDIHVTDESEVWWAVITRTQADRAIFMVPESYVAELDPSAHAVNSRVIHGALNTKWSIDATKPIGIPFEERADVPRKHWENIKLKDYIKG